MYGYNAWVHLHAKDDTVEADQKFERDLIVLEQLAQDRLDQHFGRPAVVGISFSNQFVHSEYHNRMRDHHERLLEVLRWICAEMPGSWGLVHWFDDGLRDTERADQLHVLTIRKGMIEESVAPTLSPMFAKTDWELDDEGHAID